MTTSSTSSASPDSVFHTRTLPPESGGRWMLGDLTVYLRRTGHDWLLASERNGGTDQDWRYENCEGVDYSAFTWKRWAFHQEDEEVALRPVLPDRPLVVRPQSPLTLAPKNEVLFFVSIPMWIQISLGRKNPLVIESIPTTVLSNTWFGLPTEGELCYALKSGASRTLAQSNPALNRMICPLLLRNVSPEPLPVTKLSLPTAFFSVYRGKTRFWTNEMVLSYHGHNRFGGVHPGIQAPTHEPILETLSPPRENFKEGLVRRTFGGLMGGFGLF